MEDIEVLVIPANMIKTYQGLAGAKLKLFRDT